MEQGSDCQLHLVGRVASDTRRELKASPSSRVTVADGYISDEELDNAIQASDAVSVVLTTRSGSSGMLGRAVSYGKPVIAGGNETVVAAVRRRELGPVVYEISSHAIAEAVSQLRANYVHYERATRAAQELIESQTRLGDAVLNALLADRG
jgi:glycosyltransferase involved in cell wall biosynthesis